MVDIATLSAVYGRKEIDVLSSQEGSGLSADAGRLQDSGTAQFGKDWEVDLGYSGPSGKGKVTGKKGRTL
jgi:hypothetical protein